MESRSWVVKFWRGSLYVKRKHCVTKLKGLRFPNRISLGSYACPFENKDRLGLSVKPRACGTGLDVTIEDLITKSSFTFPFHSDGFYCISQTGVLFTCCYLKELSEEELAQPMKWGNFSGLQVNQKVAASKRTFTFNVAKRWNTAGRPLPVATLFNDGFHLYVEDCGEKKLMLFKHFRKEVPCNFVSGFSFAEHGVLIKTLGHTLNRSVIIVFRSQSGNWTITLSVGMGFTTTIYDLGGFLRVCLRK